MQGLIAKKLGMTQVFDEKGRRLAVTVLEVGPCVVVQQRTIERDGYEVYEAGTGAEALEQVDRHAPDILVLDLNLPGMDGYSVITRLRSARSTKHLPIIVLTARGDEDNEVRVFDLGADDFLSKPFRARALSKRIQAVLSRARR